MSTEIESVAGIGHLSLIADPADPADIEVGYRRHDGGSSMFNRADFLAAVETECGVRLVPADAIVIERADVPLIEPLPSQDSSDSVFVEGVVYDLDSLEAGWHFREGLRRLALAEYLAARPPVPPVSDEDVETLAGLLCSVAPLINGDLALARRLLATGRVSVTNE